jgi:hypothetical protein
MLNLRNAIAEMPFDASVREIAYRVALEAVIQKVKLTEDQFKDACAELCGRLMMKEPIVALGIAA